MQAMIRGELEVLKDWCYEAVRPLLHTDPELEVLKYICHRLLLLLICKDSILTYHRAHWCAYRVQVGSSS